MLRNDCNDRLSPTGRNGKPLCGAGAGVIPTHARSRWKWAAILLSIGSVGMGLGASGAGTSLRAQQVLETPSLPASPPTVESTGPIAFAQSLDEPQGLQAKSERILAARAGDDDADDNKRLFVVIATDDLAPAIPPDQRAIGLAMAENSKLITKMIKRNVPARNYRFAKVDSRTMTGPAILNTIAALGTRPDDAILFFGSGHGIYNETTKESVLTTRLDPNGISVGQIERAVKAKNVRFAAVVVDCCNQLGGKPPGAQAPPPPPPAPTISRLFRRLFFRSSGIIVIDSSSPGEYAAIIPPGGGTYFASFFATCFDGVMFSPEDDDDKVPGWGQVCKQMQKDLTDLFREFFPQGLTFRLGDGQAKTQENQTIRVWRDGELIQPPAFF
jgi:hypothetical protein